jgi:hypothetical protein
MNVLTHFIAAEEDEIAAIGESLRPIDEWSGIERRGIDTEKIVMLHSLLTDDEFDLAVGLYEPVYIGSEGAVVLHLADVVTEKLAALEEEAIEQIADELAATEAFETEGWPDEDVHALMFDLAELARLAEAQGQSLFVWINPLLT